MIFTIFGRTDLRKGVSEAKFDVEAAGDVKKRLAPPKSTENHEKPKKKSEKKIFFVKLFFDPESFETRFGNVLQVKNCKQTAKNGENQRKIRIFMVEYVFFWFDRYCIQVGRDGPPWVLSD